MSDPVVEIPPDAVPAKGGSKIMPIVLAVNTLMITGVLIFVMKRPTVQAASGGKEHGVAEASEHAEKSEHGEKAEKHEKSGHGDKEAKSEDHGEGEADGDGPGPVLKLDAFIVQIRAPEGDRYAHLTLEVELGLESDKKALEVRMPRIRDMVIGYMSDRTEDELRGSEGLGQVKDALFKKLDEMVAGHRVHGLFITEFIIQ